MKNTAAFLALVACLSGVSVAQTGQQIDSNNNKVAKQQADSKGSRSQKQYASPKGSGVHEKTTDQKCAATTTDAGQQHGDPDAPQNQVEYRAGG